MFLIDHLKPGAYFMRLTFPQRYLNHRVFYLIFSMLVLISLLHPAYSSADLRIHFIDVGQGDSILLQCDGESMLVDAGPQEAGEIVNIYLKQIAGITSLKYVVATHEHDDHLWGMPDALSGLQVGVVYSPPAVSLTYWIDTILPRLNQNALELLRPCENESIALGHAVVTFLNTDNEAENSNDRSLVLRVDYLNTSVLLTGDIEGEAEMNLIYNHTPLSADVLKVAHHGGNTSTSEAFLNAVNPKTAVISVGSGNKHGHPHSEPLRNLEKKNITIYRTDFYGSIVGISDGKKWLFEVSKAR